MRGAKIKKIYYCLEGRVQSETREKEKKVANIEGLLQQAAERQVPVEEVTDKVLRKMSATEEPQGILAVMERPFHCWKDVQIDQTTIFLVLDGIKDPGNLGTILRVALAAGVNQICLTSGTVDVYNPKVLRSSMGAIFSQVVLLNKNPQEIVNYCSSNNLTLAVSSMEGSSVFRENANNFYPLALIIGSEADGVSRYFQEKAEKKLSIPMFNNVESLNVAMAAGIFLYEMRRQAHFL